MAVAIGIKKRMSKEKDKLRIFLSKSKAAFAYAFGFSFVMNILMLAMSLYSLQVLDRVLSSNSLETLIMLSIIMLVIFVILSALQIIRSFIFLQISNWMDIKLSSTLLGLSISLKQQSSGSQHLRDLATLKSFVTGQAITHLFDAPWAFIFLLAIFFIHPINGWVTVVGAVTLTALAWLNESMTKDHLQKANESQVIAMQEVESLTRNAEVIDAMGMKAKIIHNWQILNKELTDRSTKASARGAVISALTKGVRMTIQMATMGIGAVLVIKNQMSAGGIIATSILAGKALAPFDAAMTIWKSWIATKKSYSRLNQAVTHWEATAKPMELPAPKGAVSIEKCVYTLSGTDRMIIKGINISVISGQCIGVVGSSGSGKTTLARLMTGVLNPTRGAIRLDGADLTSWDKDLLGLNLGYLPQDIELFSGSIQENIARMSKEADSKTVIQAAEFTETHNLIQKLSGGYNTKIGVSGHHLSGGQRQRIALARAFYGNPKLVVLDEPNSNLDMEGEDALFRTIERAKKKHITTVVISHKPAILNLADYILVMHQGEAKVFDQRDKVLALLAGKKSKKRVKTKKKS
jgi:PrtD family type I secretion system ABC transporter